MSEPFMKPDAVLHGRDVLVLSPTPTWPLDAGNRKRVHRICSDLKARGARIHFVYYPFEWSFTCVPQQHVDVMASQWDTFHLLPVSRPLQSAPAGSHHTIDEWWDPVIEPMLKWLMQRGRYDAFIVNYAYLSKAFEWAVPGTLKILDTHDRFAGRREVLASAGLAPEYFYTTEEEEKKALDRADLIWAIKEEEALQFRSVTQRPVLTMPHHDDPVSLPPREIRPDEDLILGMVGARNSVNHRNAMLFIEQVLPLLRRKLAPVRIRFGGGMCVDLAKLGNLPSGIELAGRFDQPEDFYGQIDAVLVPLAFSTGLKIKAVEAFSLGLPVIAHRHAVEGIPVSHPFHSCESAQQLAECCLALAFDRSLLEELRAATRVTHARLVQQIRQSMDVVSTRIVERPTIVITAAPEMMLADVAYGRHFLQTVDYLKYLGEIVLFVDRPLPGGFAAWCERLNWRSGETKIVFSPAAAAGMNLAADRRQSAPFPLFHSVESLQQLTGRLPHITLWLDDLPSEVADCRLPPAVLKGAYIRLDALRLLDAWSDETLIRVMKHYPGLVVAGMTDAKVDPAVVGASLALSISVPFWRGWEIDHPPAVATPAEVWVLSRLSQLDWAVAWQKALSILGAGATQVRLVFAGETELQGAKVHFCDEPQIQLGSLKGLLDGWCLHQNRPLLILDASSESSRFSVLQETAGRIGIPWLASYRTVLHDSDPGLLEGVAANPVSLQDLMTRLAQLMNNPAPADRHESRFANDAGWQTVWRAVSVRKVLSGQRALLVPGL